jgi:hypothetical protein
MSLSTDIVQEVTALCMDVRASGGAAPEGLAPPRALSVTAERVSAATSGPG